MGIFRNTMYFLNLKKNSKDIGKRLVPSQIQISPPALLSIHMIYRRRERAVLEIYFSEERREKNLISPMIIVYIKGSLDRRKPKLKIERGRRNLTKEIDVSINTLHS